MRPDAYGSLSSLKLAALWCKTVAMKPSALPLALALFVVPGLLTADDTPAPLAIGAPAPDFTLPGIDGKTIRCTSFERARCWS